MMTFDQRAQAEMRIWNITWTDWLGHNQSYRVIGDKDKALVQTRALQEPDGGKSALSTMKVSEEARKIKFGNLPSQYR